MAICKRCGKDGLLWVQENGKWRLLNSINSPHVCMPQKPKGNGRIYFLKRH
jgi:hypothetical protein